MKKRHKAIMLITTGALVYSIGIMMGVSFLNGDKSQTAQQNNTATSKPSHILTKSPEEVSQWVSEIHPAAGANETNK